MKSCYKEYRTDVYHTLNLKAQGMRFFIPIPRENGSLQSNA